jgi:hypothetical protein
VKSGTGERASAGVLSWDGVAAAGQPWDVEINRYFQTRRVVYPPLLHAELVARYRDAARPELGTFERAMPILMESIFYKSTAQIDERGFWIESALPLGISDRIAGRSPRNVFVEFAPIDYVRFLDGGSSDVPRAAWLVSLPPHYFLRLYRQDAHDVREDDVTFTFDPHSGTFDAETRDAIARKTLFLVLALLRDLSEGYKPPPLHAFAMSSTNVPASVLIPQRARLEPIGRGRYFTPRALDGTAYSLGVNLEFHRLPDDPEEARRCLEKFLPHIRDAAYISYAAPALLKLQGRAGV